MFAINPTRRVPSIVVVNETTMQDERGCVTAGDSKCGKMIANARASKGSQTIGQPTCPAAEPTQSPDRTAVLSLGKIAVSRYAGVFQPPGNALKPRIPVATPSAVGFALKSVPLLRLAAAARTPTHGSRASFQGNGWLSGTLKQSRQRHAFSELGSGAAIRRFDGSSRRRLG